ncbi:MAG: type I citrate synthase [Saprospiraceae bacterium]|nr:MAG: type I citrate synthase [Saprospiraceae bacterium]
MDPLKQKFAQVAQKQKAEMKAFLATHGKARVSEVTAAQVVGGARGVIMLLWETSLLDPDLGIRFRGYSIPELREKLPKLGGQEPLPEGLFWLMLVGEIPTEEEVRWLSEEWRRRAVLPEHTRQMLDALPVSTHPMTQFIAGISSMQTESIFASRYAEGLSKDQYWDAVYEDSMNLIARLPLLAAYIYRRSYHDGNHIPPDPNLDWAANLAHMLGVTDEPSFKDLMRLYMTIHADHEGGNASAHTTHLVASTLSDPYLAFAAGMGALAGPLHGLANQEVIKWIFEMVDYLGTTKPSSDQIESFVRKTIDEGKVIPGYGHAVLRQPDPRFIAQKRFAERHIPDDDFINVVWKVYEVVPPILQSLGKVKNPWPNVDAHSGAILVHYGMKEYSFYTVLFGVSRALGVLASGCWSRALGLPLERPKSITFEKMREMVLAQQGQAASTS